MTAATIPPTAAHQRLLDASSQALLQQLVNSTPAQITTWLQANCTTIAQAQTVLQVLAVGLRYLYLKQSGN